mmetsp:Transcript_33700/g.86418  ORF Transcript_33700/g.86418 Transcript_33700/m.86418 type:complete len:114 (-) Transcript_33700:1771-2112(-)|eukprot:CAMPEP_0113918724 /NCGR_PEP_ID=MMETSP0780_2-20120614/33523_1 /TAXON_ID=652834 /ORGANISM="Palpitomonas bilix" /LENGTH=113 /DNA_ID=CAMNT_0000918589 /DNA_START=26 /DNA_END=367 /DNA_ORIENTATION=+ /assembly_acc=CAM_ASM_000599
MERLGERLVLKLECEVADDGAEISLKSVDTAIRLSLRDLYGELGFNDESVQIVSYAYGVITLECERKAFPKVQSAVCLTSKIGGSKARLSFSSGDELNKVISSIPRKKKKKNV